jgi:hypothetical protein
MYDNLDLDPTGRALDAAAKQRPYRAERKAYTRVLTWARRKQAAAQASPADWKIWGEVVSFASRELAAFEEEEADTNL